MRLLLLSPGGALALSSATGRVVYHALKPGQPTFPPSTAMELLNLAFDRFGEPGHRLGDTWSDVYKVNRMADRGVPAHLHRITVYQTATGQSSERLPYHRRSSLILRLRWL